MERTFAIIKPDAVERGLAGQILARIEDGGLHRARHAAAAPVQEGGRGLLRRAPRAAVLRRADRLHVVGAVRRCWRSRRRTPSRSGATRWAPTDPAKAEPGTLRSDFGESIGRNATHGSDAPETAAFELGYFFRGMELL